MEEGNGQKLRKKGEVDKMMFRKFPPRTLCKRGSP